MLVRMLVCIGLIIWFRCCSYMCNVLTMVSACDAKWVQHDGSCYKFVNQTWQYFGGAVAACNGLNAHLLHIGGSRGLIEQFLLKLVIRWCAIWMTSRSLREFCLFSNSILEERAEDSFVKRHLRDYYSDVRTWRTGAKKVDGQFKWIDGRDGMPSKVTLHS